MQYVTYYKLSSFTQTDQNFFSVKIKAYYNIFIVFTLKLSGITCTEAGLPPGKGDYRGTTCTEASLPPGKGDYRGTVTQTATHHTHSNLVQYQK